MKKSLFVLAVVGAFALSSCGAKPVTREEFVQKVTDGFNQPVDWQYDTVKISGYVKIGDTESNLNNDEKGTSAVVWTGKIATVIPSLAALEDAFYMAAYTLFYEFFQLTPTVSQAIGSSKMFEKGDLTYYAGSTYKIDYVKDGEKLSAEWNTDFLLSKFHQEISSETTPIAIDVSCSWRVSN